MRTLKNFDFKEKKALVRCDFNVPLSEKGEVLDDFRIKAALPTIEYLILKGAKVVLMSHLGDPGGKLAESLRLTPIQNKLIECLDLSVSKTSDCVGKETENQVNEMKPGEVLLLENLRFHKEEEENDDEFAQKLAKLGDIYIDDAFGTCHRKHASIVGVPKYLPSCAGLLLEKEIKNLSNLMENPARPLVAVMGGAKVETKAKLLDKILEVADWVLIGGLISKEIKEKNIEIKYPEKLVAPIDELFGGKDIGPKTLKFFERKISEANTIFWNGPLGQTEKSEFSDGTACLARFISDATGRAFTIVGGGETVEFVSRLGLIEKFSHVSTGGGAMIAFLAGEKLPGIEALRSAI